MVLNVVGSSPICHPGRRGSSAKSFLFCIIQVRLKTTRQPMQRKSATHKRKWKNRDNNKRHLTKRKNDTANKLPHKQPCLDIRFQSFHTKSTCQTDVNAPPGIMYFPLIQRFHGLNRERHRTGRNKKRSQADCLTPSFSPVGVTGFEPATTRPPDVYSNRAELHPELRMQR